VLIVFAPFLTIQVPKVGPVGFITPASASVGDCVDIAKEAANLVETVASLAADPILADCAGKITSFDPISIGVDLVFTGLGAMGKFQDYDTCIDMVKGTVVDLVVSAMKEVVSEFPALGQLLDAGFQLVGTSLTAFMNAGGEEVFELLKTTFSLVWNYIDCGCKIAGTVVELTKDTIALAEATVGCAATFGEAIEAVGEFIQCGIGHGCLVGGVQQDQRLNSASYSYPACSPGWLLGKYYAYEENGQPGSDWGTPNGCTCPAGSSATRQSYVLPPGETKGHSSSKVSDYSYWACKCDNPKLGYQAGGVCGTCLNGGPIYPDGTCPKCPYGEVWVEPTQKEAGYCKKCQDDEFIQNFQCVKPVSMMGSCPAGSVQTVTPNSDPYAPGTMTCEKLTCADGSVVDKTTNSCAKCKADERAVASVAGFDGQQAKLELICEKCPKNLYSPPGSTMCCPKGQVSNGEECVAAKKPGNTKGGGTNVKLDVSNPKILDETKPTNDPLIGTPTDAKKKKKGKGALCPDGQTLTTNAGCQPIKGQPRAPDVALPSERVGSDPSRVRHPTTTPGPTAPPLTGYTPGVVTTTPGGTRTPPPPAPPPLTTYTPGVTKGGGGGHTAPPPPPPPLTTYTPGVMGPGGARTMPPAAGGKP
jgi:hypothetical protein